MPVALQVEIANAAMDSFVNKFPGKFIMDCKKFYEIAMVFPEAISYANQLSCVEKLDELISK